MSGVVDIIPQHQLSAVTGVSQEVARARLLKVVWAAPKDDAGNIAGAPGLHDLKGTQRTMIVNDLTKHGVRCRIRIVSAEALREVCRGAGLPFDEERPRLVVKGPTDASYVAGDIPWMDYELTTEWREYPAIFANWLDYARSEDRRLGASYVAMRRVRDSAPGGEVVTRWQEYNVRAIDLFEFRLPGDDMGHAPLAVPGQDTRSSAEFAALHAMIAQLQHQVAALSGAPQPEPAVTTATGSATAPVIIVPGERVQDERPGPDDKFEMAGGAHLNRHAEGDDTTPATQVGFEPDQIYDAEEAKGRDAELAAALREQGGGSIPKQLQSRRSGR